MMLAGFPNRSSREQRTCAEVFLATGCQVAALDRDAERLSTFAAEKRNVIPIVTDVTDPASVEATGVGWPLRPNIERMCSFEPMIRILSSETITALTMLTRQVLRAATSPETSWSSVQSCSIKDDEIDARPVAN
jgi:hypothetical protein